MKSPKDRAIDAMHEAHGAGFSRRMFERMIDDDSDIGRNLRRMTDAIAKVIEEDRREIAKTHAPS